MIPVTDIYEPILHCLKKRSSYLNQNNGSYSWVLKDPVVGCFAPALFLLDQDGYLNLSDQSRQTYKAVYLSNIRRWMRREHRLGSVLEKLEDENIDVIPLKGIALLETIYKGTGLRSMADIDILVKPQEFLRAAEILLEIGMRPKNEIVEDLFDFIRLPSSLWPSEISFYDGHKSFIDLHQDIVTFYWFKFAFPIDITQVWDRCFKSLNQNGSGSQPNDSIWKTMLSPYDMLLHMCLHLALQGFLEMKNFLDIDLWLRCLPADWDWNDYLAIAGAWHVRSASYHVFSFCQDFFNTPIPAVVMAELKPSSFDRWQVRKLISPKAILSNRRTLGKRYPRLVKIALIDNLEIKIKTLFNLLFPGRFWIQENPKYKTIFGHWLRILQVLLKLD